MTFVYFKSTFKKIIMNQKWIYQLSRDEYVCWWYQTGFTVIIPPHLTPMEYLYLSAKLSCCFITGLQCMKIKRKRSFRRISKDPLSFAIKYTDWTFTYTLQGKILRLEINVSKNMFKSFFCYCTFTVKTYYRQFGNIVPDSQSSAYRRNYYHQFKQNFVLSAHIWKHTLLNLILSDFW